MSMRKPSDYHPCKRASATAQPAANEPTITLTRSEFVALVDKVQTLAVMGAFVFFPGMKSEGLKPFFSDLGDWEKIEKAKMDRRAPSTPFVYKARHFTDEELRRVGDMFLQGMSYGNIAKVLECTPESIGGIVARLRMKHGIQKYPYRNHRCDARLR